jgi:hypothetical protein
MTSQRVTVPLFLLGCAIGLLAAAPLQAASVAADANAVEARVEALRDRLGITEAQMPQWSIVAAAMRQNDLAVRDGIARYERLRTAIGSRLGAPDYIDLLERATEIRAEGIVRFELAFRPLYAVMTVDQQQRADEYFRDRVEVFPFPMGTARDPGSP